jgi:hypothetical protein
MISRLHISAWYYGISYAISAGGSRVRFTNITDCEFSCITTCIYMQTPTAGSDIYGEKYSNCSFNMASQSTISTPGVLIDSLTNGSGNNGIDDIVFTGCTWFQNNAPGGSGHGLQIAGGTHVQVLGGRSSGNGPTGGAGIAVTGNSGYLTVIGTNLEPKYPNSASTQNQQYAVLISGSPVNTVLFDDCSMVGYSGPPVSVTGTPGGNIRITSCSGYNDQNTIINTVGNVGTSAVSAEVQGSNGGTSYFGPSLIVFQSAASPSTFKINGLATTALAANSFGTCWINSPHDSFQFSVAPQTLLWIGK